MISRVSKSLASRRLAVVYVLVFLIGWFGFCDFAFRLYQDNLVASRRSEATQILANFNSSLSNALNQRLALIRGLGAHVSALVAGGGQTPLSMVVMRPGLEVFAAFLAPQTDGIRNISVAPDGIVSFVYPDDEANRKVLGNNLGADMRPGFKRILDQARLTHDVALHGPIALIQGTQGLIARQAVFLPNGSLWGYVGLVIDLQPMLEASGINKLPLGMQIGLRIDQGALFYGPPDIFDRDPVTLMAELPGERWQLAARPIKEWDRVPEAEKRRFAAIAVLVGGLISIIIGMKVTEGERLVVEVRQRTEELRCAYEDSQKHAQALSVANQHLEVSATVFANSEEGILITDNNNCIVSVNGAFERITGYSAAEIIGKDPKILSSGRHSEQFYGDLWTDLVTEGKWSGEIWNRRKNGEVYPEWLNISLVRSADGKAKNYIAILSDMTAKKAAEARIVQLAFHDPLTGLANRALMFDRLSHAISKAERDGSMIGLLFVDLDRFKLINDTMGHALGDAVLVALGERILTNVRAHDTVARIGGDEFVVVIAEASYEGCMRVAETIRNRIAQPIQISGVEVQSTCSIGIAFYPQDGRTVIELMRSADTALYTAKDGGRDRVDLFTAEVGHRLQSRKMMEDGLRRAMDQNNFLVYYQPQFDLATGMVSGVEALVRWQRAPGDVVSPALFIPVAEETGVIARLGEWVLRQSIIMRETLIAMGFGHLKMAVNLSAVQLRHGDFIDVVTKVMEETQVDPAGIEFEITESVLLEDAERSASMLHKLKEMGFRLAIDDFGTGYSSLAYLKQFSADYIKIDRSFVIDLPHDPVDLGIVTAINAMAHSLGAKTIAEGIEHVEEADCLRTIGCDFVQGFYFAKPMPPDELIAWLSVL